MHVCRTRKNMFSVMNHGGGCGDLTVFHRGIKIVIPRLGLDRKGAIKPEIKELLNELTTENIKVLREKYNCEIA